METQEAAIAPGLDEEIAPVESAPEKTMSLADELEARRKRLSEERKPLDLPLPGYGDKLVARYKVLTGAELKEIAATQRQLSMRHDKSAEIKGMCDTLSRACVGVFTTQDGELVPLEDAMPELETDHPVRYDENLANAVRYVKPSERFSARLFIVALFVEDVSLISHFQEVDTWMTSANVEDDEDFGTR